MSMLETSPTPTTESLPTMETSRMTAEPFPISGESFPMTADSSKIAAERLLTTVEPLITIISEASSMSVPSSAHSGAQLSIQIIRELIIRV